MVVVQITSSYFCAAVIFGDDGLHVTEAAPILKYMEGWTAEKVKAYCEQKGWKAMKVI